MRHTGIAASALAASLFLAACGPQEESAAPVALQPERFLPGTWELTSWVEADGQNGRLDTHTVQQPLSADIAEAGVHYVLFSEFYKGDAKNEVVLKHGRISGFLLQRAVPPLPEHRQTVSGSYSPNAFEMRLTPPRIMGLQTHGVLKGRLIKPE